VAEHSENDIPITELEVSVEVRALLRNVGIELIRDLKGKTADEVMAIPGLDREQVEQIRSAAARRGYLLG
jgi:DNA-directed RNA polymerase alpha subunit